MSAQPFSQISLTPAVAKAFQIGLYDPAEADLKHFCYTWSVRLVERTAEGRKRVYHAVLYGYVSMAATLQNNENPMCIGLHLTVGLYNKRDFSYGVSNTSLSIM